MPEMVRWTVGIGSLILGILITSFVGAQEASVAVKENKEALDQVLEHVGAVVADMRIIVDCRAAGIKADVSFLYFLEILNPAGQGVVKSH